MAKEQDRASSPYMQLKASVDDLSRALRDLLPEVKTLATKAKTSAAAGAGGGSGSGSPQADDVHRKNFWQRLSGVDDPDKARSAGVRSALVGVAAIGGQIGGAALAAGNDPTLTKQERGIATERAGIQAAGGGIGALLGTLIAPGIGTLIGGQLGSMLAGSLAGTHRKGEEGVIGEARSGFGDLRELAKAGYKFDNDFLQRRAKFEVEAADRGRKFDEQIAPVLGEAYDAAKDANTKAMEQLTAKLSEVAGIWGPTVRGILGGG